MATFCNSCLHGVAMHLYQETSGGFAVATRGRNPYMKVRQEQTLFFFSRINSAETKSSGFVFIYKEYFAVAIDQATHMQAF